MDEFKAIAKKLKREEKMLVNRIRSIRKVLAAFESLAGGSVSHKTSKHSAEAKRRIVLATKKRWAKFRKERAKKNAA
jgi:hypothetical protein